MITNCVDLISVHTDVSLLEGDAANLLLTDKIMSKFGNPVPYK